MRTSPKIFKRIFIVAQLILIAFAAVSTINAQASGVDLSFNVVPDKNSTTPANFILQPDDKIIVFGNFQFVNGAFTNRVARLNADGSLDTSFNCAICDFNVVSVVLQPDGKIIVSGDTFPAGSPFAVIHRLNADGSRDASFNSPSTGAGFPNRSADVRAVQPDGKILVVYKGVASPFDTYGLYRLNSDGTFDNTFTAVSVGGSIRIIPGKISVLPDGKILVALNTYTAMGFYFSTALQRFNADGTPDSTFASPAIVGSGGVPGGGDGGLINDFDFQNDGALIIVGRFASVNGVSRANIVKLLPAGNVDPAFNPSPVGEIRKIEILADGRILIGTSTRFHRLNADGSLDITLYAPADLVLIYNWALDSAGRIFFSAEFSENGLRVIRFARLNQNGNLETTFAPNFGLLSSVTAIAAQNDGKTVFAGDFVRVGGVPRISIARVNADGSLDSTFNPGAGFVNGGVTKIIIQPDGKILVAGQFGGYNGVPRPSVARLNADGSLDAAFNLNLPSGTPATIALQADGKILVGSGFNPMPIGVRRYNPDGSLDTGFNVAFGATAGIVNILAQPDGKILVGGFFASVSGFNRPNLVRLNSDGSVDVSFNAPSVAQATRVAQTEIQTGGKYIVLTNTSIVRLNGDGTADTTFNALDFANLAVRQIFVAADGSIFLGGSFSAIRGAVRFNLARLRPDGSLDGGFIPRGANAVVRAIAGGTDGRILIGGDFSSVGGVTRFSIARLNVSLNRFTTPFDYDGDGRADLTVFRPSNGFWYQLSSQTSAFKAVQFGQAGDQIAPADYDGDGKTDIAVFRGVVPGAGNLAYFYILNSSDNSFRPVQFGATGDVPVAGDWDADGKADLAVYRDGSLTGGQSYFYYRPSSQPTVNFYTRAYGSTGDKPLVGDFDGDGRLDPAVFRPSSALWFILRSSVNQTTQTTFGLPTDIPTPADFDGDGVTDIAVFRPSNGTWFTSTNPQNNYGAVTFGASGDLPVPADYDGDGRADVAVFRPSNGAWYLNRSTQGFAGALFGQNGDKPSPNAFIR